MKLLLDISLGICSFLLYLEFWEEWWVYYHQLNRCKVILSTQPIHLGFWKYGLQTWKYSHSRSAREQNDQGLIFSSNKTASPWSFASKETNLNQRAATEMCHLLIDFYKYVISCSFRYSQLKRNKVWRYWLHFPTYSS